MNAQSLSPTEYNLLELYRQHRDEIDAITDWTSLFILAFADHSGGTSMQSLARDVRLSSQVLQNKLEPLLRGQMMIQSGNMLSITPIGKRVLDELGFLVPPVAPPSEPSNLPEPPGPSPRAAPRSTGTPLWLKGLIAFLGIAAVGLIGALAVIVVPLLTPTPTPMPRPEIAIEFFAYRTTIQAGECAQLNWRVERAQWVEINGKRVNLIDSMPVCPRTTTNYALVVGGGAGDVHSVTINVQGSIPPPPPQVEIVFVADPLTIKRGDCSVMKWEVRGGLAVMLEGKPVPPADGIRVCPPQTTTYQLTVDTGTERRTQSITINVEAPAPIPVVTPPTPTFTPTPAMRQIITITPTPTRTLTPIPPDKIPPVIKSYGSDPSNTVYYGTYCGSYPTTLRIWASQVTDVSPIESVDVVYRYVSDNKVATPGLWQSYKMNRQSDGSYSFTINVGKEAYSVLNGIYGYVEYYITATDSAKNTTTTPINSVRVLYCIG